MQASNLVLHVASTARRPRDSDRGHDEDLVQKAELPDHRHESGEDRHVEDELRLDEIGAGPDFLLKSERAELERRGKWVLDRADKEVGRLLQLAATEIHAAVAQTGGDLDELHRVDVVDAAGFGMIASGHIVTTHQYDVVNPEGGGTQQVGLQREAI